MAKGKRPPAQRKAIFAAERAQQMQQPPQAPVPPGPQIQQPGMPAFAKGGQVWEGSAADKRLDAKQDRAHGYAKGGMVSHAMRARKGLIGC